MGIFFALVTVRSVELVSSFVRLCRTAFTMTYSPLGVFFDGSVHWTSLAELNVWRRKNSHLQSDSFTKAWRALFPSTGIRVSKGALGKYVGREKEHKGSGQMLLKRDTGRLNSSWHLFTWIETSGRPLHPYPAEGAPSSSCPAACSPASVSQPTFHVLSMNLSFLADAWNSVRSPVSLYLQLLCN